MIAKSSLMTSALFQPLTIRGVTLANRTRGPRTLLAGGMRLVFPGVAPARALSHTLPSRVSRLTEARGGIPGEFQDPAGTGA